MTSTAVKSPAWSHVNTTLPRLVELLGENPTMIMKSDEERIHPTHDPDNIHFIWLFCKATHRKLLKVPAHLPADKEEQWEEVVGRCEWIDGMINDNTGDLDAVTGQYPGQTSFSNEEKECANLLAVGLEENLME